MKVKVKDLKPNPFRDLENYPFNMDKIDKLKKSIEATGFWDNILARQVNGDIQIAYGHHRLKALQEVYSDDYMVEVPIKDLSDELMLKIMANENMEEWQSSVAVIDETIKATIMFCQQNIGKSTIGIIKEFLEWPKQRVIDSFARINAIKDYNIDKKAVETIPTATAATAFTSALKGKDLTTGQQRRVANRIAEGDNYSHEFVKRAVIEESEPPTKKKVNYEQRQMVIQFDDYLNKLSQRANEMKNEIVSLINHKSEIRDFNYDQFENRVMLKLSLEDLQKSINKTLKELNNE